MVVLAGGASAARNQLEGHRYLPNVNNRLLPLSCPGYRPPMPEIFNCATLMPPEAGRCQTLRAEAPSIFSA